MGAAQFHIIDICPLDVVNPGGGLSPLSNILNATPMFDISNRMASYHKVCLFLLSISSACFTYVGISMPYVCVDFLSIELILAIIVSFFLKVQGTYHAKVGSSWMPLAVAYTAMSTGFDSLKSLSGDQVIVPSFHLTRNFQPTAVFLM